MIKIAFKEQLLQRADSLPFVESRRLWHQRPGPAVEFARRHAAGGIARPRCSPSAGRHLGFISGWPARCYNWLINLVKLFPQWDGGATQPSRIIPMVVEHLQVTHDDHFHPEISIILSTLPVLWEEFLSERMQFKSCHFNERCHQDAVFEGICRKHCPSGT